MTSTAPFAGGRSPFIIPSWFFQTVWLGLVAFVSLVVAFLMASGAWILAGILLGLIAAPILLMAGFERLSLLWLLVTPTLFTYVNNAASMIPVFTVERMLFLVIYFILIVRVLMHKREGVKLDVVEKFALFLLLWMLISMVVRWATVTAEGFREDGALLLTGYAMPLGAYGIARRIKWSELLVDRVAIILAINGAIMGIISALQFFLGVTIFNPTFIEVYFEGQQVVRAIGTFSGGPENGVVAAVTCIIALYAYCKQNDPARKLGVLILFGLCFMALILSLTRAPWLAFVIGASVFALYYRRVRPLYGIFVFAGGFAIVMALPYLAASGYLEGRILELSPIYNRIALWATGLNVAAHNPFFGVGFGANSFAEAAPEYLKGFGSVQAHWVIGVAVPHNEVVHLAVLSGFPAAVVFVLMMVTLLRHQLRTINNRTESELARSLSALALAVLIVYGLHIQTLDIGFARYIGILVFFVCGMAAAVRTSVPAHAS